jgi:hypothetical protein
LEIRINAVLSRVCSNDQGQSRLEMRKVPNLASSLAWAIVIVSLAMRAAIWLQQTKPFPWWHMAMAVFIVPMALLMEARGRTGGPHANTVIFVLAVVMWWILIEGSRRLWRRRR